MAEEQQELLNKKIGSIDLPKLEAKEVEVQGLRVDEVGEKKMKILVLICKHPNKEELIDFTKIKVLKNDKAKVVGLWYQLDKEENIQKGSSIHELLRIAKVESLGELEGKKLPTVKQGEDNDYLCIKGY